MSGPYKQVGYVSLRQQCIQNYLLDPPPTPDLKLRALKIARPTPETVKDQTPGPDSFPRPIPQTGTVQLVKLPKLCLNGLY